MGCTIRNGAVYLFDASHVFLDAGVAALAGRATRQEVTAFVSSPLTLLPVMPMTALPYFTAAFWWRAALALAAIAGLHSIEQRAAELAPDHRTAWACGLVAFTPLLAYGVSIGQTSALLLLAGSLVLAHERSALVAAGAAIIGFVGAFKVFPIALLGFLALLGRWRAALAALALLVVWTIASLALIPMSVFVDFVTAAGVVGSAVNTDWNSLAIEALVLGHRTGQSSPLFVQAEGWVTAIGWLLRAGVGQCAVRVAGGWTGASFPQRWAVACAATMTLTPLLWTHYLAVLPLVVLPVFATRGRWGRFIAVVILLGAGVAIGAASSGAVPPRVVSDLTSLVWHVAVGVAVVDGLWPAGGRFGPSAPSRSGPALR